MSLKRKRSSPGFSPFSNSSCSEREPSSSPPRPGAIWPFRPDCDVEMHGALREDHQIDNWSMTIQQVAETTSVHLHSRTRKRFRDDRPDDQIIHGKRYTVRVQDVADTQIESTYHKLFSAQRSLHAEPAPIHPRTVSGSSISSSKKPNIQPSLHEFWSLPHRPSITGANSANSRNTNKLLGHFKCQDCDIHFGPEHDNSSGAMDIDMANIADDETEYACGECRRIVCDMCAVVSVGDTRKCLECKTSRKRWVGGIGWITPAFL